jgi:hypothetical protein
LKLPRFLKGSEKRFPDPPKISKFDQLRYYPRSTKLFLYTRKPQYLSRFRHFIKRGLGLESKKTKATTTKRRRFVTAVTPEVSRTLPLAFWDQVANLYKDSPPLILNMSFQYDSDFYGDGDPFYDPHRGHKWLQDPPEQVKHQVSGYILV